MKSNTCIGSSRDINNKDPQFKISDTVRISKYNNIFAKGSLEFGQKMFFGLKKFKILWSWRMLWMILMTKNLREHFTKENCKKQIKKFRIEKVIRK